MIDFCHLHGHSRYSFKDGQDPVVDLVERAAALGQPGIGLTDHGVLFGAPDLFKSCETFGIKGLIGMEVYEAVPHRFDMERDGEVFKIKWADLNGRDRYYHLTLWVLNLEGWRNICAIHSRSWTADYHPTQRGKPLVDRATMEEFNAGLAVGLGCPASRTNVTLERDGIEAAYEQAKWYADVFEDRCYVECMANLPEQQAALRGQRTIAARIGRPSVATNDYHYAIQADGRENGPHHVLVQARSFKKADTEASADRSDDGFGSYYGSDGFFVKTGEEMLATGGLQLDEITRTVEILDRVDFDFSALPKPKPPIAAVPAPGEDILFDAFLAKQGT